jgi:hypothetical protein
MTTLSATLHTRPKRTSYVRPTKDDVGRKVASVRGVDGDWRSYWNDDVIVHDVDYNVNWQVVIQIGLRTGGLLYWYAARDVKIWRGD